MGKEKRILVMNGPNLNLLGKREPSIYGYETLDDIKLYIEENLPQYSFKTEWFQSNSESALIEKAQTANLSFDAIVINPGAFSHTSIALLDALKTFEGDVVEVHLSNTHKREEFRQRKITALAARGIIEGFGKDSYLYGFQAILKDRNNDL